MRRPERMAEALRAEVSEIVGFELKDPRLEAVTVTDVRVADNLRDANVFVLIEGDEIEIDKALKALRGASSYVRKSVALNLDLRFAPQLHFLRDTVEENATKMDKVLGELDSESKSEREDDAD